MLNFQDSPYIHFLEEDSHTLFNLPVPTRSEERFENVQRAVYYLGVVTDKQHCLVKREGTRYRVPVGTRFYRVRVKPLLRPSSSRTSSISENEQVIIPCPPSGRQNSVSEVQLNTLTLQDVASSASNMTSEGKSIIFFRQFVQ